MSENWYSVAHPEHIPSPGILFYQDRIRRNIAMMIAIAGDANRLVPHSKTHKTIEVLQLQLQVGITKFKVSTIAEAEMAAMAGAHWVLLAYPLVGPNIERFATLIDKYPDTQFHALVDNNAAVESIEAFFSEKEKQAAVFIDVNDGMNRTGIETAGLVALIKAMEGFRHLQLAGLHIYDGHLRNPYFEERRVEVNEALEKVLDAIKDIRNKNWMLITGGTPSFTVHALREGVYCSPGTCLLWDWGYDDALEEQLFEWAAVLLTRVVSKPTEGIITIDLGHKAVSAENPVNRRVKFLNLAGYELLSQSEEHGVLKVANWKEIQVGDVLYGIPYHVCPTVALYETATVIEHGEIVDEWNIISRKRKITI
ncbi:MAG: D-TA family PLP-dependent enzyme [Siphonobacter sp.]